MNDTERLREIATSILEKAHDNTMASKAGELLKLAAEIENQRAEARKLAAEEQKINLEVKDSRQRGKSDDRKTYIALLAPVFTTVVLAGTLVVQSYQFDRSEKDKQIEARRQAGAAEDLRWTEAIKLLAQSEKLSPAGVLLKSFAKSDRYSAQAYKTAVQILVKTDDPQLFVNLFGSVFDPVDWNNLSQVVDLNRIVDSRWKSLTYRSLYAKKQTGDVKKLTQAEKQELEHLSTKLQFIAPKFAPVLKGLRPVGAKLDLRSVDLWTGDFQGADLSGANLSEADLTALDLKGANLTGITEYQGAAFVGTAWWEASGIGQGLLEYLVKTYPFDPRVDYASSQPIAKPDYDAGIARLRKLASSP
jgi:uncharacterized protein YjbI with pentapeptide repeats